MRKNIIQITLSALIAGISFNSTGYSAALGRNEDAKRAKKNLDSFVEQCSFLETDSIITKKKRSRLSSKRLIRQLKKVIARKLPNSLSLWDNEIYRGADSGLSNRPATFEGFGNHFIANYEGYLVQDSNCSNLKADYLEAFDVFGVEAKNRRGISVVGHIYQKRFGNMNYMFIVISMPFNSADRIDLPFETVEDLVLVDTYADYSDSELVDLVREKRSRRIHPVENDVRLEQIKLARETLIRQDATYGESVYLGEYISNGPYMKMASWKAQEYLIPSTGHSIDVVYFDEFDDGSYSFYFEKGSKELIHVIYEN